MTLYEQWENARDNFQHYALRGKYDTGDGFRRIVTNEDREYCINMANHWDNIIKHIRQKIISDKSPVKYPFIKNK